MDVILLEKVKIQSPTEDGINLSSSYLEILQSLTVNVTKTSTKDRDIFDFELMNKYFGEKYGVYLFDAYTCNTKINITYHNKQQCINITDHFLNHFLDFNGNLFVSQNTYFKK